MAQKSVTAKAIGSAKSASKRPKSTVPSDSPAGPVSVKVGLNVTEDTPVYYANHLEVGHSRFEFMLNVARFPPKPSVDQMQQIAERGAFIIEPEMQILFSPRVALGLLEALKSQIASYEANEGEIK